jgi:CheY-like chemotaxis protein
VDDDFDIRDTFQEILESAGYTVALAENGKRALEYLKASADPPCLILLDIMMPVMDGWQFRDEQVKHPELAEIPVVVVTADNQAEQKGRAMAAAAAMRKPVGLRELLDTVANYC